MIFRSISILGLFAFASSAFAVTLHPDTVMVVQKRSGFVEPRNSFYKECAIGEKLVTGFWIHGADSKVDYLDYQTIYTDKVKTAEQARALIAEAAVASLKEGPAIADIPSSSYAGLIVKKGDPVMKLIGISEIGSDLGNWTNQAKGAEALKEFGDANCKWPWQS